MTDRARTGTLGGLLDACAVDAPDTNGLTVEAADGTVTSFTYAELATASLSTASGLARLGISPADRVVVQLPNCVELVLSWLGLARLGAIFVPSNVANTADEIGYIAERCGAGLAIARRETVPALREAGFADGKMVLTNGIAGDPGIPFAELVGTREPPPVWEPDAAAVMELVFTSGTTAAPKAAMITHANARYSGWHKAEAMGITSADTLLTALPAFHVNAQSAFLAALTARAPIVLLERFSASRYVRQLAAYGATVTSLVGTQVRTLLRQEPTPGDRAHRVRRAWFALNVREEERTAFERRFGIRLLNGYGLTEAYTTVTQAPLDGPDVWPSVGLPVAGRALRIVDERGDEVPPGGTGEILVRGTPGQTIMAGYWDDEAATRAAISDGWLHTGDFGSVDEQGLLSFVERKANMIKRAGENVAAGEVESVLLDHPEVVEVAVVGVDDAIRDEAVKAFVVLAPGSHVTVGDLERHCASRLAAFKVPTLWALRDELPKTSIGKIEHKRLRAESQEPAGARR